MELSVGGLSMGALSVSRVTCGWICFLYDYL